MKRFAFLAVLVLLTVSASAFDTTGFQIGIWPSTFQLVPDEINVSGLKINLPFSRNDEICGLDIGFASSSKKTAALQVNLFINRNHDDFSGIQASLINQNGNANGIILGLWNVTDDKTHGVELGIVNGSTEFKGLQVGLVNYTEMMRGLQIGLINIITESVVPVFPIINFCF